MDTQIMIHLIEIGLLLLSFVFSAMSDTKILKWLPVRITAIVTTLSAIIGMAVVAIYDIVIFVF